MISFPSSPFLGSGRIASIFKLIVILVCVLLSDSTLGHAQEANQVKAAFLYNFAKFVEWPSPAFADDNSPMLLGILNQDPLGEALEGLSGKVVQSRRLVVKRSSRIEDLKKCHILFLSPGDKKGLAHILGTLTTLPVLTVTDDVDNFARLGGIINLITVEDKIRFEINMEAADRVGLKISSQLLKLAKIVKN